MATTPYTAIQDVIYRADGSKRSADEMLSRVLERALPVGGPGAATAAAVSAAPPTAECGAIRRAGERAWRPLIWMRTDQGTFTPYALERRCVVLPAGCAAPDGWEVR